MKQVFRTDLPRVRQLTADEATALVWRNDGPAAIVTGKGRPGHAAIMLRSDHLPIWSQDDIREQQDKMRSLGGELIDARTEFLLCGNDVNAKNEQIRKLGPAGGAQYIKLTGELSTLREKQKTAEREVQRINAEIEKLRIWQNPNMVRWFYLSEADQGFNRHGYISWFPSGAGVGSKSDMKRGMEGEQNTFWEDMDCEISARSQENLADGTYKPQPGQIQSGKTYGRKDASKDEWVKEPDLVVSVPALGAANRYWGVNCSRMWTWFEDYRDQDFAEYRMISSTRSCAGIAMRALANGGGDAFSKQPNSHFYVLPNEVADYAVKLRAAIVDLNAKSARFEFRQLVPWKQKLTYSVEALKKTELWTAAEWRRSRENKGHTWFSVGDHLEKYHNTDACVDWVKKYRTLVKIFNYLLSQVGDDYYLVRTSHRNDALLVLGAQCLNIVRATQGWIQSPPNPVAAVA
jgi:hypothetical protein